MEGSKYKFISANIQKPQNETKLGKHVSSINYQLSTWINDRQGNMRIENGYYNKDYGFLC